LPVYSLRYRHGKRKNRSQILSILLRIAYGRPALWSHGSLRRAWRLSCL